MLHILSKIAKIISVIIISIFILFLVGAALVFLVELLFDLAVALAPIIVMGVLIYIVLWYAYSEIRKHRKENEPNGRN